VKLFLTVNVINYLLMFRPSCSVSTPRYDDLGAAGSNVTDDSGLDCLTPHDSSADELDEQQRHDDVPAGPSSSSSLSARRSTTPTSITTDSELDDTKLDQPAHHFDCKSLSYHTSSCSPRICKIIAYSLSDPECLNDK